MRLSDPLPMRDDEAVAWCRACDADTWHHLAIGQYGATKSCDDCGEISDHEVIA